MSSGNPNEEWLAAARPPWKSRRFRSRAPRQLGGELVRAVDLILAHPARWWSRESGNRATSRARSWPRFAAPARRRCFSIRPKRSTAIWASTRQATLRSDLQKRNFRRAAVVRARLLRDFYSPLIGKLGYWRVAFGGAVGRAAGCSCPRSAGATPEQASAVSPRFRHGGRCGHRADARAQFRRLRSSANFTPAASSAAPCGWLCGRPCTAAKRWPRSRRARRSKKSSSP